MTHLYNPALSIVEFVAGECIPEIRFPYKLVAYYLCRRTGPYHTAVVDDVCLVNHLKRSLDIVVGDKDADTGSNEPANLMLQILNRNRVNAAERFIKENQRRICHHRTGDFKGAVGHLERAVELRPEDPVINDHLGDAYWRVGRLREARFQWTRSLSLEPAADQVDLIRGRRTSDLAEALGTAYSEDEVIHRDNLVLL